MFGASLIIAVDPGMTGAVCVLDVDTNDVQFFDLPTIQCMSAAGRRFKRIDDQKLHDLIRKLATPYVVCFVVETQSGFGPIPGATKFSLGEWFGLLRGLIISTNLSLETVKSQTWKKDLGLRRGDDTIAQFKDRSRLLAVSLFPDARQELKLKGSHNKAEALLICEWARRHVIRKYIYDYQPDRQPEEPSIFETEPIADECEESIV